MDEPQTPLHALALIAQIPVGYAARLSSSIFRHHWHEVLSGKPLPALTQLSLDVLPWVPYLAAFLLLSGLAIPFLRVRQAPWAFSIVLLELITVSLLMMGFSYPSLSILYNLE